MKTSLCKFGSLAAVALLPAVAPGADAFWTNTGVITFPPQIDAVNFVNSGTMFISSLNPFETSNTRNFTNSGTMIASPGWFFHRSPSGFGERVAADNFVNEPTGRIEAQDPFGGFIIGVGGATLAPSYLWVNATNILNRGLLSVGANGWLKLTGDKINLTRSGVEVTSIVPVGSQNVESNFFPEAGIDDIWWGGTNGTTINSAGIWRGALGIAQAPAHQVTRRGGSVFPGLTSFSVINPYADSYAATNETIEITLTNLIGITNITGPLATNIDLTNIVVETFAFPTNITRQAVFVGVSDPSVMSVGIGWLNSSSPTNFFKAPHIEITTVSTNVITATPELNTIYILDTLASETNRGPLANLESAVNAETYRPANYIVSRIPMAGFGMAGNGYPENDILFQQGVFTNAFVAADWAGYAAFIDNLPAQIPFVPGGTVTNLPGRVQIYANELDVSRTRLRGQGEVIVKTEHLVGSSNAVVDSEHLSFTLASTNNRLNLIDLAKEQVARTRGPAYMWSAVWENQATYVSDNWTIITNLDTNDVVISLDATNNPVTNTAVVGLYALVVDAESLLATLPVTVWDFVTRSDNVEVNDNMTLVQSFFMDAMNFTLNGRISLSNASWTTVNGTTFFSSIPDWTHTNAPNILNFTNNGLLRVPNNAHFGDDRADPYQSFVNRGTIRASSMFVDSTYFQNSGSFVVSGPLQIDGGTGSFENGSSLASSTRIRANNLRLNNYRLDASLLNLEVPGVLADTGFGSSNVMAVTAGFHLTTRPTAGDLLGTTLDTALPDWVQTDHTWGGADRGATAAGYENNAAVGSLVISRAARDPLAYFKGAQPGSALYVDYLDIYALGDNWDEWLAIDPSLTIYYAVVRANFTPPPLPNGIPQSLEEYLDGKLGGRLRWVRDYAGGRSSVAVLVDGVTVFMNSALRNSRIIDSDNDGTPNYFDTTPLGGSSTGTVAGGTGITLRPAMINPDYPNAQPSTKAFSMTWTAAPNTVYQVEVATDLVQADWQPLTLYTNRTALNQTATFSDTNTSSHKQRFYRVRAQ